MSVTTEDKVSPTVFLSVFTAYLPEGRYSTEVGKWTNAVKALRDRYEKEHPELFLGFSIHERPPMLPYSPEIDRWLTHLYAAMGAPGGPTRSEAGGKIWLEFPPSFQELLKVQNIQRPHLEEEVILTLQKFAEEAAQKGLLVP